MAVKKSDIVEVNLTDMSLKRIELTIVGDSPLIMHKWSEKAIGMIRDKQQKKAAGPREARNPEKECEDALYRDEDGDPCFPSIAFKSAAVSSAIRFTSKAMKGSEVRGFFHIEGETVKINGDYRVREDQVRVGMGAADLRYRPEFKQWSAKLKIIYNERLISAEQIANLFNYAGFGVGVGEWRPEKDGQYGMFHVQTKGEVAR